MVHCARGDQGVEDAVPFAAVFTAEEEPILSADFFMPELDLGDLPSGAGAGGRRIC